MPPTLIEQEAKLLREANRRKEELQRSAAERSMLTGEPTPDDIQRILQSDAVFDPRTQEIGRRNNLAIRQDKGVDELSTQFAALAPVLGLTPERTQAGVANISRFEPKTTALDTPGLTFGAGQGVGEDRVAGLRQRQDELMRATMEGEARRLRSVPEQVEIAGVETAGRTAVAQEESRGKIGQAREASRGLIESERVGGQADVDVAKINAAFESQRTSAMERMDSARTDVERQEAENDLAKATMMRDVAMEEMAMRERLGERGIDVQERAIDSGERVELAKIDLGQEGLRLQNALGMSELELKRLALSFSHDEELGRQKIQERLGFDTNESNLAIQEVQEITKRMGISSGERVATADRSALIQEGNRDRVNQYVEQANSIVNSAHTAVVGRVLDRKFIRENLFGEVSGSSKAGNNRTIRENINDVVNAIRVIPDPFMRSQHIEQLLKSIDVAEQEANREYAFGAESARRKIFNEYRKQLETAR